MKAAVGRMFKPVCRVLARKSLRYVSAILALFGLIIGGGTYLANNTTISALHTAGLSGTGTWRGFSPNIAGSEVLSNNDPVKNFYQTGVGHVLYYNSNSESCRRTLFDNKGGAARDVTDVSCGRSPQQAHHPSSERLEAIRRAFKK
jgi:hypothetical protein